MKPGLLVILVPVAIFAAGCGSSAPRTAGPSAAVIPAHTDVEQFREEAQAIVDAFAAEVARIRSSALGGTPTAEVRDTPQLIFFNGRSNTIVAPWWATQPAEMRGVFRTFAAGNDAEAEHLFRAFFNRFLIAHEAAHWFQARSNRREQTLYENENVAHRIAVAFWRTHRMAKVFWQSSSDSRCVLLRPCRIPHPLGKMAVAYFGANYQTLGRDPLKYGDYQFRFMAEALRERSRLDFATMVAGGSVDR